MTSAYYEAASVVIRFEDPWVEHALRIRALEALLEAVKAGDTLRWAMKHAPDGDADRVVRDLWEIAPAFERVSIAAAAMRAAGETSREWKRYGYVVLVRVGWDYKRPVTWWSVTYERGGRRCAVTRKRDRALRRTLPCPTWAELTGGRRG